MPIAPGTETTPYEKYIRLKEQTIPASSRYEEFIVSLTKPDGELKAGTNVENFELNFDFTPLDCKLRFDTASSSTAQVDINANGTSILTTKVTVDAGETSSLTAATPPVVKTTTLPKGTVISFDVDQDSEGLGAKIHLIGERI